jgi:PAS domain-containing protein/predicted  nucleic acid-binding Zn-ribbon protein
MRTPALAVVGADHQIIRSTETFRRDYEDAVVLCERAPELDLVLTGETDAAVVDVGDFSVAIEAVTDAAGKRQAMLSLPGEDLAADPQSPLTALREAADESPAIVWVKDLEGRYLYVNTRFERDLDTESERVCGNTDADLPPAETVDGPRLRYTEDGLEEPLQLEYSVPAFESRPSMAAFRFALRDGSGQPTGTCGVAAPTGEAQIARDEAVRLMQLERWNRLDPLDVRAELLEQWHVRAKPGPVPEASSNGHRPQPLDGDGEASPESAPAHEPAKLRRAFERAIGRTPSAPADVAAAAEPEAVAEAPASAEASASADGSAVAPAEKSDNDRGSSEGEGDSYRREAEWVRQLRQAAAMAPSETSSETADALQSDLQLARKWAERADQLQGDLHDVQARLREAEAEAQQANVRVREVEAEAQQAAARVREAEAEAQQAVARVQQAEAEAQEAVAAAALASEESIRHQTELEQVRLELEAEKADAQAARSEADSVRRELEEVRAQAESLRGPADAAFRLSEELGRALAAERERGDELAETLSRIRARLEDLESAQQSAHARS